MSNINKSENSVNKIEYKQITVVESIVPMGLGRSRIIEHQQATDYSPFTTKRTSDGKQKSDKKRKDAKIDNLDETLLLNFYSGVGINFQNIASNDALISSKINEMVSQGWEIAFVNSGVESDSGDEDGKGIFITRYIFKRTIN
ncbi:hypothetical protein [Aureivirga marina]|uniref:hypothetical protein n=1 Tax=Aureivirga marina TaxID=1182451 RepID=UPI0037427D4F